MVVVEINAIYPSDDQIVTHVPLVIPKTIRPMLPKRLLPTLSMILPTVTTLGTKMRTDTVTTLGLHAVALEIQPKLPPSLMPIASSNRHLVPTRH